MRKTITIIFSILAGTVLGSLIIGRIAGNKINRFAGLADKYLALFLLMNQWMKVKQNGKSLAEYLQQKGYRDIAIYGVGYAGETLVHELEDTEIHVMYGIDQNTDIDCDGIQVVSLENELKKVDAVVVTAITFFDEIKEKLSVKLECPIISLEDILYRL